MSNPEDISLLLSTIKPLLAFHQSLEKKLVHVHSLLDYFETNQEPNGSNNTNRLQNGTDSSTSLTAAATSFLIDDFKSQIQNLKSEYDSHILTYTSLISEEKQKSQLLQSKLSDLKSQLSTSQKDSGLPKPSSSSKSEEKLSQQIKKLNQYLNDKNDTINTLETQIKEFQSILNDKTPQPSTEQIKIQKSHYESKVYASKAQELEMRRQISSLQADNRKLRLERQRLLQQQNSQILQQQKPPIVSHGIYRRKPVSSSKFGTFLIIFVGVVAFGAGLMFNIKIR